MKEGLQIIDFRKKGNLIRFYIGDASNDYYGDDWNDRPYEHNAGTVYDRFISKYMDVAFSAGYCVLEPADDWRYRGNSPFCKDDMKEGKCPCLIVLKDNFGWGDGSFSDNIGNKNTFSVYFGDDFNEFIRRAQETFGDDFVCFFVKDYKSEYSEEEE